MFEWKTVSKKYGLDGYFLDFGWITAKVFFHPSMFGGQNNKSGWKVNIGEKKGVQIFETEVEAKKVAEELLVAQSRKILKTSEKL